ncbi:MAG: hypothetical protein HYT69_00940 [Candidatus Zambryskibacteria bacterium]|nr:hypothetical protein [Candidatus Zambryskibacteria bacterium]
MTDFVSWAIIALLVVLIVYATNKKLGSSLEKQNRQLRNVAAAGTAPATTVQPIQPAQPVQQVQPRAASAQPRRNSWLGWLVAAVAVAMVIGPAIWFFIRDQEPAATPVAEVTAPAPPKVEDLYPRSVMAGDEGWSEVVKIPAGSNVIWDRTENVSYAVITDRGKIYEYPRDPDGDTRTACEKHIWISEAVKSFRIRVLDAVDKEVKFKLTYYPYNEGGPCQGVKYKPPTAPAPPPPRVTTQGAPTRVGAPFSIAVI